MANSGHFVDFFDSDDDLITATASFLTEGFGAGCSCIAVLTREHLEKVRHALSHSGLDLQELRDDYRFVGLDAVETLAQVWSEDHLDMCGYHRKFDELIRLMSAGGKELYIVGEIVGLLAQRGEVQAVIQAEELCNELSREHAFRMYCLYSDDAFVQPLDDDARRCVCATHSGLLRAA
jgi:hypothetical protein